MGFSSCGAANEREKAWQSGTADQRGLLTQRPLEQRRTSGGKSSNGWHLISLSGLRLSAQCHIVFPLSDIYANSGADAHVRGRPPGRPLLAPKHPHPQKERDEGVPRRPGGLPHLISAGISPLGKLCGIRQSCLGSPLRTPFPGSLFGVVDRRAGRVEKRPQPRLANAA